jgi:hypothetical protein
MPHRIPSPVTHQPLGRRGACLLIFGFIPFCIGAALFVQPTDRTGAKRTIPALEWLAPTTVWATAWIILGAVTMACAFMGVNAQRRGYMIAYSLPLMWGAGYAVSWLLGLWVTGWISAIVYLGYSLLVIVIAGWEEPAPSVPVLPEDPEDDRYA